jgi:hypothetical protein
LCFESEKQQMLKLFYWLFAIKVSLCNCHSERKRSGFVRGKAAYRISKIGQLPDRAIETSGLAKVQNKGTFWTHNDGGNAPELIEVDSMGHLVSVLPLPNLTNYDWEDLASDNLENLYIADIGNNNNDRRSLQIYKLNPDKPASVETIRFNFADQRSFPPPLIERNFDCEALIYKNNNLYLFSKNRSPSNRYVKLYTIPAQAGNYSPSPSDSVYIKSMVTGASISPDGHTLALMSYGKVLLFDVSAEVNFKKPISCIKVGGGQAEAILFVNNTDFIFTNEQKRNMYLVKRRGMK